MRARHGKYIPDVTLLNAAVLAGTLLAAVAAPVYAEVMKVEATGTDVKNACPNMILSAKGVIQVDRPSTITYFWQFALFPPNSPGQQKTINQPQMTHKFTTPGSINVPSLPITVPKGYKGLFRLIAERYVSNSVTQKNECPDPAISMGIVSIDESSRCMDGTVLLQTYVNTVAAPVTIRYTGIVNGQRGNPESKTFATPGHHNFTVRVRTNKSERATVGWAIIDPVALQSKPISTRTCPATPPGTAR